MAWADWHQQERRRTRAPNRSLHALVPPKPDSRGPVTSASEMHGLIAGLSPAIDQLRSSSRL